MYSECNGLCCTRFSKLETHLPSANAREGGASSNLRRNRGGARLVFSFRNGLFLGDFGSQSVHNRRFSRATARGWLNTKYTSFQSYTWVTAVRFHGNRLYDDYYSNNIVSEIISEDIITMHYLPLVKDNFSKLVWMDTSAQNLTLATSVLRGLRRFRSQSHFILFGMLGKPQF